MLKKFLTHARLQVAGRSHSAPRSGQANPGVSAIMARLLLIYPCGKSAKAKTSFLKHKQISVLTGPHSAGNPMKTLMYSKEKEFPLSNINL